MKRMSVKEFAEDGWLQEANRLFFHPRGLALEITVDKEETDYRLSGIWDERDDPEGLIYDFANQDPVGSGFRTPKEKRDLVEAEFGKHVQPRIKRLGAIIERIPEDG